MNVAILVLVETVRAVLQTVTVTPSAVPVVTVAAILETHALYHLVRAGLLVMIPAVAILLLDVLGSRMDPVDVTVIPPVEVLGIAVTTLT